MKLMILALILGLSTAAHAYDISALATAGIGAKSINTSPPTATKAECEKIVQAIVDTLNKAGKIISDKEECINGSGSATDPSYIGSIIFF